MIDFAHFEATEIRVGTILSAVPFEKAKKPAYILSIDFGECGILKSSAQITALYSCEELVGKQIIAVVNFPPKQIANIQSQCLVLGIPSGQGEVVLLQPERLVENGLRVL